MNGVILVVQKFLLEITDYGRQIWRIRAGLYRHRLLNENTAHATMARIPYISGSARKAWFTIDEKGRNSKAQERNDRSSGYLGRRGVVRGPCIGCQMTSEYRTCRLHAQMHWPPDRAARRTQRCCRSCRSKVPQNAPALSVLKRRCE